jgi:ATP-dependent Lon protease
VRIAGYDLPEKVEIANRYLIPKALKNAGLVPPRADSTSEAFTASGAAGAEAAAGKEGFSTDDDTNAAMKITPQTSPPPAEVLSALRITKGAVHSLVRWYCREAGVRQLAQKLERVARKLALNVVRYQEELESKGNSGDGSSGGSNSGSNSTWSTLWPFSSSSSSKSKLGKGLEHRTGDDRWVVDEESLSYYVGKPLHTKDRLYDGAPPPGVVMGLAWTNLGGTSLYIEVCNWGRGLRVCVHACLYEAVNCAWCAVAKGRE